MKYFRKCFRKMKFKKKKKKSYGAFKRQLNIIAKPWEELCGPVK